MHLNTQQLHNELDVPQARYLKRVQLVWIPRFHFPGLVAIPVVKTPDWTVYNYCFQG